MRYSSCWTVSQKSRHRFVAHGLAPTCTLSSWSFGPQTKERKFLHSDCCPSSTEGKVPRSNQNTGFPAGLDDYRRHVNVLIY